ncbi:hypothetical protein AADB82_22760, partial [Escherichia coli]
QSIHILRGVRQQQDEPGRFSICSRQAAVVQNHKGMRLGKAVLDIMTDGKISHVKVPERQDGE